MPLPTEEILTQEIKSFVDSQKKIKSDESPEDSFANGLAKIILNTIKKAQVDVTVTGTSATGGPVTGTGTGGLT